MQMAIEVPQDIAAILEKQWGDLSRHAVETLAVEGYRSGLLSRWQVQRMLGFETRMQVDEFLKQAGVYLNYTEADLAQDLETIHRLRAK